jgi:hypothetical protein
MCWSSDWEEQELVKDEERREDDERRIAEIAREAEVSAPERERELVRV